MHLIQSVLITLLMIIVLYTASDQIFCFLFSVMSWKYLFLLHTPGICPVVFIHLITD